MKVFCGILIVAVLLHKSESASLVRNKRFFNSLWPSAVKDDVQTGIVYAQLPPGYMHMLPGVNDHLQKRADVQQPLPIHPSARFVHPTRMAILMQPHHQQPNQQPRPAQQFAGNLKPTQTANVQPQQGPKIVMRPVGATTKLHPSITLKTKEQALPDIHKNQRFVQPKPAQNYLQPFSGQQQLPIKKAFDEQDNALSQTQVLTVDTASIDDFYYTKEFQELLREFNIKVDISKLPPIQDVMAVMGTENAHETIRAIKEVAESSEGRELIRTYLDQSEGDEFYNYDEDVGAGEIHVGGTEEVRHFQTYSNDEIVPLQNPGPWPASVPRATTTGTLTGEGQSWWRPSSWFGGAAAAKAPKVDSLKKDAEILKNIVPASSNDSYLEYWRKFFTPVSNSGVPISPPFKVDSNPRRIFIPRAQLSPPVHYSNPVSIEGAQVMPTIRLTEEQFQDMVETLKLRPMGQGVVQGLRINPATTQSPVTTTLAPTQAVKVTQKAVYATQTPAPVILKSTTTQQPPEHKFHAPINVPSFKTTAVQTDVPLPSTFSEKQPLPFQTQAADFQKGNRRNFEPVSEPQRSSPYDFTARGIVHKANEEEVKKRSRSLAEAAVEEEKSFVAAISDLTEQQTR